MGRTSNWGVGLTPANVVAMADGEKAPAKTETRFSWLRTRLSVERTLMSWIRAATALIAFGFTIFQFFEHINKAPGMSRPSIPAHRGSWRSP